MEAKDLGCEEPTPSPPYRFALGHKLSPIDHDLNVSICVSVSVKCVNSLILDN